LFLFYMLTHSYILSYESRYVLIYVDLIFDFSDIGL
jgi:hypothetical protein